jgi:hypothetical protein
MMNIAITWADLAHVKKAAKAAKNTLPNLSHAQRLDAIASAEYGVRHFHELQQHYQAAVNTYIKVDGGAHYCRYCDFTFDGTLNADVKEHRERHQRFEEAEAEIGFCPAGYREREHTKQLGYEWMRSANASLRREGALAVLLAHFERSLARAINNNYWHKHPYFDGYVACALPGTTVIPEAIRKDLANEFGERKGVIPHGQTDWPPQAAKEPTHVAGNTETAKKIRSSVLAAISSHEEPVF